MTDSDQPSCPICGVEFETWNSIKGHITRKTDSEHKGLSGPDVIDGNQSIDDTQPIDEDDGDDPDDTPDDDGTDGGLEFPEADTDDGNHDCDHPEAYDVGAGTHFTTEDGREGVTEEGDRYCPDCDGLVEPDGTVIY